MNKWCNFVIGSIIAVSAAIGIANLVTWVREKLRKRKINKFVDPDEFEDLG